VYYSVGSEVFFYLVKKSGESVIAESEDCEVKN